MVPARNNRQGILYIEAGGSPQGAFGFNRLIVMTSQHRRLMFALASDFAHARHLELLADVQVPDCLGLYGQASRAISTG